MFTIGTSNRTEAEFFSALTSRSVRTIVDVRSRPTSRLPQFRGTKLAETAPLHGMRYKWMGEVLGGLNDVGTNDPAFLAALDRLLALEDNGPVAIFCAEGHPNECHRVWKAGAALLVHRGVDPINILRDGRDESVSRTLLRTRASNIPPCIRERALKVASRLVAGSGP